MALGVAVVTGEVYLQHIHLMVKLSGIIGSGSGLNVSIPLLVCLLMTSNGIQLPESAVLISFTSNVSRVGCLTPLQKEGLEMITKRLVL